MNQLRTKKRLNGSATSHLFTSTIRISKPLDDVKILKIITKNDVVISIDSIAYVVKTTQGNIKSPTGTRSTTTLLDFDLNIEDFLNEVNSANASFQEYLPRDVQSRLNDGVTTKLSDKRYKKLYSNGISLDDIENK